MAAYLNSSESSVVFAWGPFGWALTLMLDYLVPIAKVDEELCVCRCGEP